MGMFQQIININMQRKKSEIADYQIVSQPASYNPLFYQHTNNPSHMQQNHQNFFMKYASSIIEVISEEKLEKSNRFGAQAQQKDPIYDISQVKSYEMETLDKNSSHKTVQANNYNNFGQGFKKKTNKKHVLVYNFTNITLFLTYMTKIQNNLVKNVFYTLKSIPNKHKSIKNQPPKSKSSFHSDYTACTANQDTGIKKLNNFYRQMKRNQQVKQSINMIKGWVQFRLLIIKNQSFKSIKSYITIKPTHKESISHNFPLINDQSLFLVHHDQQSLVYTADQNFQLSQKEITVSTPQKPPFDQKFNNLTFNKQSRGKISQFATPNNHQSIVEVYKLSQVGFTNSQQNVKPKISQAYPIILNFDNQSKRLTMKTNTFQLPLISQFYLKDQQIPKQTQFPLRKDTFVLTQSQCQLSNEQIIKQFQLFKAIHFKQKNTLKRSQFKSKLNIVQERSSKINVQCTKTIKIDQLDMQKTTQKISLKNINVQKKGPHKVDDYYFPGVQSRIDRLIQTKSRIKIIGDKKSANQTDKSTLPVSFPLQNISVSKNIRIQESIVRNYPFQNQSRISRAVDNEKDTMVRSKQKKISFNTPLQQRVQHKVVQKIGVGFNSPQHKIATSPQNLNINIVGNNQLKRKPYFSPQSTLRHFECPQDTQKRNHVVSKPIIEQQYNQVRALQQSARNAKKDIQIPPMQNNVYQINYPNQQQKAVPSNLINYYHKMDEKYTNVKTVKQIHQSPNYRAVQQNLSNRPSSKILSPINQLNMPLRAEQLPYGIPTSRQISQKKISFHSPQANRNNHPQIIFSQQSKPQQIFTSKRQDYINQYFVRQDLGSKPQQKTANFNYKYYTFGANMPSRPNQIIQPIVMQPSLISQSKPRQTFGSQRPHSSFRQSSERFNIFSNYSPMQSQIQNHIQRSNNFSSRNSSQIKRPKSMNDKIFVTMRRER